MKFVKLSICFLFFVNVVWSLPNGETYKKNNSINDDTFIYNEKEKNFAEGQNYLNKLLASIKDSDVPDSVDWRNVSGRVTPVKDQEIVFNPALNTLLSAGCMASYAFAALGVLEGQMTVRNKSVVSLSAQNIVDCSKRNQGCHYGKLDEVFWFVKRQKGVQDSASYPYKGFQQKQCLFNPNQTAFYCSGATILPKGNEIDLKKIVATFGPVAAVVDSTYLFRLYDGGVFYDKKCYNNIEQLDQAVLIVGYGTTENKEDYWILKNSWGTSWGEDGYMRLARNKDNHCGIATRPVIPFFKE